MAWTNLPNDQRAYVRSIEDNLLTLQRRVSPNTLYSTTAPTEAQIQAAWALKYPPAYAPTDFEMTQWVDPASNTLKNHYGRLGGVATQRPLVELPASPIAWTRFGEIYADDAGLVGTQTFSAIPQTHRHLYLYILMRDAQATAAINVTIRINGSAATLYGYNFQSANNAMALAGEQIGQTGFLIPTPGNTSHRGFYHEGLFVVHDYASTLRGTRVHHRGTYLTGATINTANSNTINGFGLFNSAVAVTSLSIVSATGFVSGTRFVLFGV